MKDLHMLLHETIEKPKTITYDSPDALQVFNVRE